jgi:hypothetical protein
VTAAVAATAARPIVIHLRISMTTTLPATQPADSRATRPARVQFSPPQRQASQKTKAGAAVPHDPGSPFLHLS